MCLLPLQCYTGAAMGTNDGVLHKRHNCRIRDQRPEGADWKPQSSRLSGYLYDDCKRYSFSSVEAEREFLSVTHGKRFISEM